MKLGYKVVLFLLMLFLGGTDKFKSFFGCDYERFLPAVPYMVIFSY